RLAGRLFQGAKFVVDLVFENVLERINGSFGRRPLGGQSGLAAESLDQLNDLNNVLMPEQNRLKHSFFGHLTSEAFDHGDGIASAGNNEVQIAVLHLRMRGHGDEVIADSADADAARDFDKRNVRDVQSGAGADHAEYVLGVLAVERHGGRHDLHFAKVIWGKERADGPVDEPAGENFLGGGPSLALDEASGEFAGRVGLFAIIDDQGEEITALLFLALDR